MMKLTKNSDAPILILPIDESQESRIKSVAEQYGLNSDDVLLQFSGKNNSTFQINDSKNNRTIVWLGLGDLKNVSLTFRKFFFINKSWLRGKIGVDLTNHSNFLADVANGISLAEYRIGSEKTDEREEDFFTKGEIEIIHNSTDDDELKQGIALAESQKNVMALVDAPSNKKTPEVLANYVLESSKKNNFKAKILDKSQSEKEGLFAFLAVAKGSIESPPKFIIMEYEGGGNKTIGLVGKGVTFDTGGISLKPGDDMNYMKMDMAGGAAVIGMIEVAAKLKLKVNLIGIVPATENSIDSLAIKPGDVINSYAGKTIEVINTDAEGRLILADALSYITKNYKPDTIVDLATLTGSCIRALGYEAAGLMTKNEELAQKLYEAGLSSNEKLWRLPLWDEYKDAMNSDVADIKNLSSAPLAGAITAGKFLEFFTNQHHSWAHIDIAGPAYCQTDFAKMHSSTAFGIKLLFDFIKA